MPLLFWTSAFLLFSIYLGYPLLIWMGAKLWPRPFRRGEVEGTVSVILAAYNEASRLPVKIASLRQADLGHSIFEIIISSDGSTDGTREAIRALGDEGVQLLHHPERRGKPAALNDAAALARGEILVFTDARQMLCPGSLKSLLGGFADPGVGVISGELVFRDSGPETTSSQGMGFYWRYEKFIRRHEALTGSVPGATGALYAMRRHLFQAIPPDTILDDVAIPMMAMGKGARCVFEPQAILYDDVSTSVAKESLRKRRTIAGCFQLARRYPRWWLPGGHPVWFRFLCHKVLRLGSPFLLILLCLTNGVLALEPGLYRWALAAQACFYGLAVLGAGLQRAWGRAFGMGPFVMFVALNRDTLRAAWDAARGRFDVKWAAAEGGRRSEV